VCSKARSNSGIIRSQQKHAFELILFDLRFRCGLTSDTHMRRSRPSVSAQELRACALVVILVFMIQAAYALPRHENHAIHKEIENLEQQWRQALVSNNVSIMDHLLADDYIGISANGTIETKAQALAQRRAGTVRITQLELNDLHVRVYGDTAVVTSKAQLQGTNGESDIGGQYRYTRVYNRRFGQWKIVSFEASRIHDSSERSKH